MRAPDPLPPLEAATPADVVRSLAFYVVFYLGSIVHVVSAVVALALGLKSFVRIVTGWSGFHRRCCEAILGIRVEVEGTLPMGRAIVALKHESFFEAIDLPTLLENPAIFAKAELLRLPLWGRAAGAYGLIPVERDQGAKALRAMLAEAKRLSAEGRLIAIFPEGTRVPRGVEAPLGAGFAGVYKLMKLPVVPVAIDSGRLYRRVWKKPGVVHARVGETVPPGLAREELEARILAAINAFNR